MQNAAIPISILLGFAILGAAIHTKENNFETCVRLYRELASERMATYDGQIFSVQQCTAR
jgi:hypothetical protein